MGQANHNRTKLSDLLKIYPKCIFCGGGENATTIDHIPPISMFNGRQRPKGMEFPACKSCNNGSRHVDMMAAFISRAWPEIEDEAHKKEFQKYLLSAVSNIDGLQWELITRRGSEKIAMKKIPTKLGIALMNVGPIVNEYMKVFCMKLALALHFQSTKKVISDSGGITVKWFSNYDHAVGSFPANLLSDFQNFATLSAGTQNVFEQFKYSTKLSNDSSFSAHFTTFRNSFSVFSAIAEDAKILTPKTNGVQWEVYSPKDLRLKIDEINLKSKNTNAG